MNLEKRIKRGVILTEPEIKKLNWKLLVDYENHDIKYRIYKVDGEKRCLVIPLKDNGFKVHLQYDLNLYRDGLYGGDRIFENKK